ncbi:tyrosine-protein kinase family protein [Amnibacterium flavum]|uniref:Regulator n=1 Tax=Amnibacterium flavum TaxID=2173173 RepID=A0A2V1HUG2_9MICO|nr:tyrosine-protein kinase family protein [Amnibacterium flavum]PVZ95941.1 regulator [Amnibacterium flavum]
MRIVLSLTPATEERLLGALIGAGHEIVARPAGAAELAAALASLRPDVALVSSAPGLLGTAVVTRATEVGVRLIALASGEAQRAHAETVDAAEVIDEAVKWPALDQMLSNREPLEEAPEGPGARARGGTLIAVWGPTGAPGRTTTAITLASELAAEGRRVALVDADTHGAAIAASLGLFDEAPGFAAACRLAGSGGLDLAQLDRVSTAYRVDRGEMLVLTGISRPSRWPELSAQRVEETLAVARDWVDAVVVDCGFNLESDEEIMSDYFAPRRNAATLTVLAAADRVVAVGSADPIGIARLIRGHADLAEIVDPARISVVVSKVRTATVGLGAAGQITGALQRFAGIGGATLVPSDPTAYDAALLNATTLRQASPKSPALAALAQFTRSELVPLLATRRSPIAAPASRFAPLPA